MAKTVISVESIINNPNTAILEKYGKIQQSISRTLFNHLTHNQITKDTFKSLQKEYIKKYNIKARMFKSIWIDVKSKIESLTTRNKQTKELYKSKINFLKTQKQKSKEKIYHTNNKINKLKQKLNSNSNIQNVWGTKALFKKQWHNNHEQWLKDWRRQRDNRIYLIGSKDETFGNSLCQLQTLNKLVLTLPNSFEEQKKLILDVNFDYKKKQYKYLQNAIRNNQALTYTIFQRDNGNWYVVISFYIEKETVKQSSAIGVDINYNLITTCNIKTDGNAQEFKNYKFNFENSDKNQIKQELCNIVFDIVINAKINNKNIIIEDINLDKCKVKDNHSNRKIHMIAYSKFITLLKSKAVKEGVMVIEVNPAFTSIIGKLKYKKKLGRSIHSTAAYVIGRRGMKLMEKIPAKLASLLYGKEKEKSNWSKWGLLSKRSTSVHESDFILSLGRVEQTMVGLNL